MTTPGGGEAREGLDALVVGAGQSGLAAGYHLKRAGLSFKTRSVMEPTGQPASVTPPRRVRDVGPTFGGKRCCGLPLP